MEQSVKKVRKRGICLLHWLKVGKSLPILFLFILEHNGLKNRNERRIQQTQHIVFLRMVGPISGMSSRNKDKDRTGKSRYNATVEKGDNAWRREWQGFISGVRMTDSGNVVKLPSCMDYEQQDGSSFSYLFQSQSQKKQQRSKQAAQLEEHKRAKQREKLLKKQQQAMARGEVLEVNWSDPFNDASKHQKAVAEALARGIDVAGKTRKEIRQALQLTVSEETHRLQEQADAQEAETNGEKKPHELMDPKQAWYQQGPFPIDVIAEKLVNRKAVKRGNQLGLRYNYLMVHASWMASRQRKRRDAAEMASTGVKFHFDDEGVPVETEAFQALQLLAAKRHELAVQQREAAFAETEKEEEEEKTEGEEEEANPSSERGDENTDGSENDAHTSETKLVRSGDGEGTEPPVKTKVRKATKQPSATGNEDLTQPRKKRSSTTSSSSLTKKGGVTMKKNSDSSRHRAAAVPNKKKEAMRGSKKTAPVKRK